MQLEDSKSIKSAFDVFDKNWVGFRFQIDIK